MRERIERICASACDARTLRLQLLDELRKAVRFDAYAWLLTDPVTSVGSAPLADVPCLHELPRAIRLKYLTTTHRWTSLTDVALLSDGDPSRSLLWRDLQSAYGIADVASLVFRDRHGCWGFLDLWSTTTFTRQEAAFLKGIAEPVTAALRRSQAHTFTLGPPPEHRDAPAVLLLSPDLEVRGQTPHTSSYLHVLVPPPPERPPVPAGAYNVAAQLLAVEAGVDANPPSARVHLEDGLWLTLRAARLEGDIAVTIEQTSPADRADLFARACALSPRESEVLGHLMTGGDTREIARLMFVSENTVQDHLKSVFAKTATRNRRSLLARALGSATR